MLTSSAILLIPPPPDACGRRVVRWAWDACMFQCVIRKRGRVPASDSVLVRRVAGPGLLSHFYYQISVEQALAAFEARLELGKGIEFTIFLLVLTWKCSIM